MRLTQLVVVLIVALQTLACGRDGRGEPDGIEPSARAQLVLPAPESLSPGWRTVREAALLALPDDYAGTTACKDMETETASAWAVGSATEQAAAQRIIFNDTTFASIEVQVRVYRDAAAARRIQSELSADPLMKHLERCLEDTLVDGMEPGGVVSRKVAVPSTQPAGGGRGAAFEWSVSSTARAVTYRFESYAVRVDNAVALVTVDGPANAATSDFVTTVVQGVADRLNVSGR